MLSNQILQGDRRALARALTAVENGDADKVIAELFPRTGSAITVGVTGSPGSGKSTLVDGLIAHWRSEGRQVAVIAVDPTSPFSGGALLGDRVRMQDHALDPGVFIRSMATRGHLGGLATAVPSAINLFDAAGYDVVCVETVGVGQSEVEIARQADTTIVVLAPGMGDGIQAAKAGILEIADVFCVNKADKDGARQVVRDLRGMQELGHGDWLPPIIETVATERKGIDALSQAITDHRAFLGPSGLAAARRRRIELQVRELVTAHLQARIDQQRLDAAVEEVVAAGTSPHEAARKLLDGMS